jgi:hypothetical protein
MGENSAGVCAVFGPTEAYALERICSSGIRLCFGSLRFVSFASLNADDRRGRISDQNFRFKSEQAYCWPEFLPRLFSSTMQSQPPQEQWRIPSLLGVRMTDRAVTSVREFAPQWLLRSFLDSSNSGDVGERRGNARVELAAAGLPTDTDRG